MGVLLEESDALEATPDRDSVAMAASLGLEYRGRVADAATRKLPRRMRTQANKNKPGARVGTDKLPAVLWPSAWVLKATGGLSYANDLGSGLTGGEGRYGIYGGAFAPHAYLGAVANRRVMVIADPPSSSALSRRMGSPVEGLVPTRSPSMLSRGPSMLGHSRDPLVKSAKEGLQGSFWRLQRALEVVLEHAGAPIDHVSAARHFADEQASALRRRKGVRPERSEEEAGAPPSESGTVAMSIPDGSVRGDVASTAVLGTWDVEEEGWQDGALNEVDALCTVAHPYVARALAVAVGESGTQHPPACSLATASVV